MKIKFSMILLLGLFILEKTYGYVYGPVIDRSILYNQQYTTFVKCQINGTILKTTLASNIPVENVPPRPIMDEDVPFYLYTRKNPYVRKILRSNDSSEKLRSFLNVELPTTFYVHGFNQTISDGALNFTKYLLPKRNVNIIIVDWDSYSFFDVVYTRVITVPRLGKIVGRFVEKLTNVGVDPKKIHLFGFSAGGEVVGLAGKTISPRVGRISAFDPEGTCYNLLPPAERISKGDADFVQIVHCSVGIRALPPSIQEDVTFIMNEGVLQPECEDQTTIYDLGQCSHMQCETYLYESLKGNSSLVGTKCSSFSNYFLNQCDCQDRLALTYDVPTSARGLYFVDTVSNKPCGYQKKGTK